MQLIGRRTLFLLKFHLIRAEQLILYNLTTYEWQISFELQKKNHQKSP